MKKFLAICFVFFVSVAQSQDVFAPHWKQSMTVQSQQGAPSQNILKHAGQYTKADWRKLIDSVWGPGLPTTDKLQVYDFFWNTLNEQWGGFANLDVNWDSLRSVYRTEIAGGVSRGRFAGILSRLCIAIEEKHSGIFDQTISNIYVDPSKILDCQILMRFCINQASPYSTSSNYTSKQFSGQA